MEIYKDKNSIPVEAQNAVLAIGNFDGVHKGHQELLRHARKIADEKNLKLAVLTFEPHPRHLLRPDDPPFRLTPEPVKARRLEIYGIDLLFSLTFNWDFASQSAGQFIENILTNAIKPAHIVVGNDFHFGQLRKGNADTLRNAGYGVTVLDKIADEGDQTYSSSRIRSALRHGEIGQANALLGWEWEIEGTVFHGDKRGREIGFPTANVALGETLHPAYGVYASWIRLDDEDDWHPAATNIGIRPMFELQQGQIEAHILDFDRDIYDRTLRVKPVKRLRGEAKFESLKALIEQIRADCAETQSILGV